MKKITLGTIAAAGAAAGALLLGSLPSGAQTIPQEVATLTITKTVVGTAPTGTEFVIHLTCVSENLGGPSRLIGPGQDFDQDIVFGATGGSEDVIFDGPSSCTITETDDGGADSSTGPVDVQILEPIEYSAEIVNTFDDVTTTTAAPTTAPPAAAAAVTATPAFTG